MDIYKRFTQSTRASKISRITVSVSLYSLKLTALLLKKFHLRLHCYTLPYAKFADIDGTFCAGGRVERSVAFPGVPDSGQNQPVYVRLDWVRQV